MFLRKLFKIGDKGKWLLLELLIVFVGVYLAFLFQDYEIGKKVSKEKEKVLVGLKLELEEFRTGFDRFANFQEIKIKEWDSLIRINQIDDYYNWRYLEPQYNFKIIEYALNQEGTEVVDFDLYKRLSTLYVDITKLEHAERLMTELGMQYNIIPPTLDATSKEAVMLFAENKFHFKKFIDFATHRADVLRRVSQSSQVIVNIINAELGPEKTKEVDLELLGTFMSWDIEMDFVTEIFKKYFPEYSEAQFNQMVEQIRSEASDQAK